MLLIWYESQSQVLSGLVVESMTLGSLMLLIVLVLSCRCRSPFRLGERSGEGGKLRPPSLSEL